MAAESKFVDVEYESLTPAGGVLLKHGKTPSNKLVVTSVLLAISLLWNAFFLLGGTEGLLRHSQSSYSSGSYENGFDSDLGIIFCILVTDIQIS
jgi:hypothetical protein